MIFELPIFRQVRIDPNLTPSQKVIWCTTIEHLDVVVPRKIPWDLVQRALRLDRSTLGRAVNALADGGFLCKEPGDDRTALYRVPLSRAECARDEAGPTAVEVDAEQGVPANQIARVPRVRKLSGGVF